MSSSTSSSESRRPVALLWTVALILPIELVLFAFVLREDYGCYWHEQAEYKIQKFRGMAARGEIPEVLILGDSTSAMSVHPAAMNDRTFNLGIPAHFPHVFDITVRKGILEDLPEGSKIWIFSFSPRGFGRYESLETTFAKPILQSRYAWRLRDDATPFDWLRSEGMRRQTLFKRFAKTRSLKIEEIPAEMLENGFHVYPRLARATWPFPDGDVELVSDRVQKVARAFRLAESRGIRCVFIIPPLEESYYSMINYYEEYRVVMRELCAQHGVEFHDHSQRTEFEFGDGEHLNEAGALAHTPFLISRSRILSEYYGRQYIGEASR